MTASTPELYRLCGISRPLISEMATGNRNQRNCDESKVREGSNLRQPVSRASRTNPNAASATKATARTPCSQRQTAAGMPITRKRGPKEGENPREEPSPGMRQDQRQPYQRCDVHREDAVFV